MRSSNLILFWKLACSALVLLTFRFSIIYGAKRRRFSLRQCKENLQSVVINVLRLWMPKKKFKSFKNIDDDIRKEYFKHFQKVKKIAVAPLILCAKIRCRLKVVFKWRIAIREHANDIRILFVTSIFNLFFEHGYI